MTVILPIIHFFIPIIIILKAYSILNKIQSIIDELNLNDGNGELCIYFRDFIFTRQWFNKNRETINRESNKYLRKNIITIKSLMSLFILYGIITIALLVFFAYPNSMKIMGISMEERIMLILFIMLSSFFWFGRLFFILIGKYTVAYEIEKKFNYLIQDSYKEIIFHIMNIIIFMVSINMFSKFYERFIYWSFELMPLKGNLLIISLLTLISYQYLINPLALLIFNRIRLFANIKEKLTTKYQCNRTYLYITVFYFIYKYLLFNNIITDGNIYEIPIEAIVIFLMIDTYLQNRKNLLSKEKA